MGSSTPHQLILFLIFVLCLLKVESHMVNITYVDSAVAKGAVCLDGSPPAYHFSPGFGKGVNNWIVHFEGGGWCSNAKDCLSKKNTYKGSSMAMVKKMGFSGILGNKQKYNPDFYSWNKVKVRYCDGSSFTGDVEAVHPETKLHYRGARVFLAIIEDLKEKGMSHAANAMISGCSAGALASILHCDKFRSLLPATAKVKCLSDAGYFINVKDLSGSLHTQSLFNGVVTTHASAKNLPSSCTSKMSPGLCFFPENVVANIQTPLFLTNAAYDSWQIKNTLAPHAADPKGTWDNCKSDIKLCSSSHISKMQEFRSEFLSALDKIGHAASRGLFINSCYAHCQIGSQKTWLANDSPMLHNKTIAKAVGDWYFERNAFRVIDCPYPCDSTCHNRVYDD